MIYGSVCSGIEAATSAWHVLGWKPAFFSEIEPFPSAALAHHYPDVPNHGDMTKFEGWPDHAIDLLVGGTPCQSFSLAGLRKGLDDERGNLMLVYAAIARRYRPRWMVWENVPGVLSSDGGRDFASLLGLLSGKRVSTPPSGWETAGVVPGIKSAYGLAWRVLDAQFTRVHGFERAVPQRRRRVFVIGYLGDWRRAAAVLLERESLSGNSPPRREAGKGVAPTLAGRTKGGGGLGTDFDCDGGLVAASVAPTLNAHFGSKWGLEDQHINQGGGLFVAHARPAPAYAINSHAGAADGDQTNKSHANGGPVGLGIQEGVAYSLRSGRTQAVASAQGVALRGREEGATAELTGDIMTALRCGGGGGDKPHVLMPVAFAENSRSEIRLQCGDGQISPQLTTGGGKPGQGQPCIAFNWNAQPDQMNFSADTTPTLSCSQEAAVHTGWRVRRLTPVECERLQGFQDGFTAVPYRGKPAADGPRHRALGNSMACNVMRWLGRRIEMVEAIPAQASEAAE